MAVWPSWHTLTFIRPASSALSVSFSFFLSLSQPVFNDMLFLLNSILQKHKGAKTLYEFCHDLYLVKINKTEFVITLTRSGDDLTILSEILDMHTITYENSKTTLTRMHHYIVDQKNSLYFVLADLESISMPSSFLLLSNDSSSIFIAKNYDRTMLIQMPSDNILNWTIQILDRWINTQTISSLNDLSAVAYYQKNDYSFLLYINNSGVNEGISLCKQ